MRYRNQPPGSPPIFLPQTPPPRLSRHEIGILSLSDGQVDTPMATPSPTPSTSRTSALHPNDNNNNQPLTSSPQYPRPSRTVSIPRLSASTPDDTSEEEDNQPTPTSTTSGIPGASTSTTTSKDPPDYLTLYTHTLKKYGPHRPPTPQEWGKETTLAYPKMYHQVSFLLWREAWERLHPPPLRTTSPEPHHSVQGIKRGIATVNLIETPNQLIKSVLAPTHFPHFTVGVYDAAEFVLVPAPEAIASLRSVYAPWDKQLLGGHMLSLLGDSRFIFHVLGTLRKREMYERDLPFRESGYCICVKVDGRTGRCGAVYAIKSQSAGDCWLGWIAGGVEELGVGLEMSLETVFPRAQRGVRTARVLVVEEEEEWVGGGVEEVEGVLYGGVEGKEGMGAKGKREVLRGSHWYADEVGVEKAWEID